MINRHKRLYFFTKCFSVWFNDWKMQHIVEVYIIIYWFKVYFAKIQTDWGCRIQYLINFKHSCVSVYDLNVQHNTSMYYNYLFFIATLIKTCIIVVNNYILLKSLRADIAKINKSPGMLLIWTYFMLCLMYLL